MRLIDANKLFDFIQKEKAWKQDYTLRYRYDKGKYDAYYEMLDIIKEQPTIEAEPIVHGYWIRYCDGAELQLTCNKCGYDYIEADPDCTEEHKFCPDCGAKMDEDKCET